MDLDRRGRRRRRSRAACSADGAGHGARHRRHGRDRAGVLPAARRRAGTISSWWRATPCGCARSPRSSNAAHGVSREVLPADLTRDDDVDRVVERIAELPELALLVNNAGFGTTGSLATAPPEQQERMLRLHVLAPMRLTRAALPGLLGARPRRRHQRVVDRLVPLRRRQRQLLRDQGLPHDLLRGARRRAGRDAASRSRRSAPASPGRSFTSGSDPAPATGRGCCG